MEIQRGPGIYVNWDSDIICQIDCEPDLEHINMILWELNKNQDEFEGHLANDLNSQKWESRFSESLNATSAILYCGPSFPQSQYRFISRKRLEFHIVSLDENIDLVLETDGATNGIKSRFTDAKDRLNRLYDAYQLPNAKRGKNVEDLSWLPKCPRGWIHPTIKFMLMDVRASKIRSRRRY